MLEYVGGVAVGVDVPDIAGDGRERVGVAEDYVRIRGEGIRDFRLAVHVIYDDHRGRDVPREQLRVQCGDHGSGAPSTVCRCLVGDLHDVEVAALCVASAAHRMTSTATSSRNRLSNGKALAGGEEPSLSTGIATIAAGNARRSGFRYSRWKSCTRTSRYEPRRSCPMSICVGPSWTYRRPSRSTTNESTSTDAGSKMHGAPRGPATSSWPLLPVAAGGVAPWLSYIAGT